MKNLGSILAFGALLAGVVSSRALPTAEDNVAIRTPYAVGEDTARI